MYALVLDRSLVLVQGALIIISACDSSPCAKPQYVIVGFPQIKRRDTCVPGVISPCVQLEWVNLLCVDEAHHASGQAPYALIMTDFYFHPALDVAKRPHVFGMTASPINVKAKKSLERVSAQIEELERMLDSTVRNVAERHTRVTSMRSFQVL